MEVIVAIFVIVVGLVGVLSLVSQTIFSSTVSKDKLIAAYLAQEGIEIVRNIRDTNWIEAESYTNDWDEGLTGCSTGCRVDYTTPTQVDPNLSTDWNQYLNIDGSGFYSYSPGTPTKFKRKITIGAGPIGDSMNVKVEVFWEEKGKTYSFESQENLYNWK